MLKSRDGKVLGRWHSVRGGATLVIHYEDGKGEAVEIWVEPRGKAGITLNGKGDWRGGIWFVDPHSTHISLQDKDAQTVWKAP